MCALRSSLVVGMLATPDAGVFKAQNGQNEQRIQICSTRKSFDCVSSRNFIETNSMPFIHLAQPLKRPCIAHIHSTHGISMAVLHGKNFKCISIIMIDAIVQVISQF